MEQALPRRYTYVVLRKSCKYKILVWHEKACQVFRKEKRDPNVAFLCHAIISSKAQKIPHERELFSLSTQSGTATYLSDTS